MNTSTVKSKSPFGFYVCSLGFTFERAAFYTVKYMLAIWIATSVAKGGLGLTDVKAASMAASFLAWTYIAPVFGGYVADYWLNPRLCVTTLCCAWNDFDGYRLCCCLAGPFYWDGMGDDYPGSDWYWFV